MSTDARPYYRGPDDLGDRATRAVERFMRYQYHREHTSIWKTHLVECSTTHVRLLEARDGAYDCDCSPRCEYLKLVVEVTCGHGEAEVFEYGRFDRIDSIIRNMIGDEPTSP